MRSIISYASPAWEIAADSYLLKLQHLQNKVLRTTGNLPRRIPTRNLHMAFNILYLHDFVTKLCRRQASVMKMSIFATLAKEKLDIESIKTQTWWRSGIRSINCLDCGYILGQYVNIKHNLLYRTWTVRRRKDRTRRKQQNENLHMYYQHRQRLAFHRRPPQGKTHHNKHYHNCLHYSQNLVMSPRRAQCQGELTDSLTHSLTE
jgi:hypothetical protein